MPTPRISLTSFIDYFVAQSPTKVAKVRAARRMMDGEGFDHWLVFRRAAIAALVAGGDKSIIRACIASAGKRTSRTYTDCGEALIQWIGHKSISANPLASGKRWTGPGLQVSVNPELKATINGGPEMNLKLYFKADTLSKRAADPMLRLIELKYGHRARAAILDVRRGRLHIGPVPSPSDLDLLLQAEATGFSTIWSGL